MLDRVKAMIWPRQKDQSEDYIPEHLERAAKGLSGFCEHGVGMLDACDLCDPPCGCRWVRLDEKMVKFVKRCEQHAPMCRSLEQWELDLIQLQEGDK